MRNLLVPDLFTPENTTPETLQEAFDAALFEPVIDEDGDLYVRDQYKVFVTIHRGNFLRFSCAFRLRDDIAEADAHALCNRIHDELIIIRACVPRETTLLIDWYLPLRGGIAKRAVMRAFREFNELISSIGKYDVDNLIQ